jgi:hypothetical protein
MVIRDWRMIGRDQQFPQTALYVAGWDPGGLGGPTVAMAIWAGQMAGWDPQFLQTALDAASTGGSAKAKVEIDMGGRGS